MKIKCVDSRVNVNIFASTSVPFILTTVQVPNLALTRTKRITVWSITLMVEAFLQFLLGFKEVLRNDNDGKKNIRHTLNKYCSS